MRVLFARLTARYEGRISADLTLGDYVVLIRDARMGGNGSVLVYSDRELTPRNWMPAGSVCTETDSGLLFEHLQRGERLELFIHFIHWEQEALPEMTGELLKLGAEREFADLIAANLHRVDAKLTLLGREVRTTTGPIDLLCESQDGRLVVVEVKRRRVAHQDTYQVLRYTDCLQSMPEWKRKLQPHGILIAPTLAKNAKAAIDSSPKLRFVRLSYEDLSGRA